MASLNNFNAAEVSPGNDFEPIPAGRYNVIITDSEMVTTKAGDGEYLKLTFKVLEGDHVGRLIWTNLNLDNPNPKAVEIAQRELSAICRAVDVMTPEDSTELHGIPLSGMVKIRKGTDGYADQNTISGFKEPVEEGDNSAPWA
jgi:hypothetical protein